MQIYNTLSGQKENLEKALGGEKKIRLFVCGPTVYDAPHLGHARIAVFFDLVKKYLASRNYNVKYIQNITDVDDKIIERAHQENRIPKEVAGIYEKEYLSAMKALGVKTVNKYPRASAHVKEIVKQIQKLIDKDFAYKTSSGIYFEVKKFSDYGKLSKQNLNELRPGWRIEPDPEKKDPLDFALWKFKKHDYAAPSGGEPRPSKDGREPSWPSPWGAGRPGWHIEDTAITEKYFGPRYDLHGGGMDLKFPHHESEIAQQESASGLKPFVKIWMHVGFLLLNGEKMSKSLKNFITVKDFLKNYSSSVLRLIFFQHHYRSPIDYSQSSAPAAKKTLDAIAQLLAKLKMVSGTGKGIAADEHEKDFRKAMDDDFNSPEALAAIFSFINLINEDIWKLSKKEASGAGKWLLEKLKFLEIAPESPKIPLKIRLLAKKRELLRSNKQFVQSDGLRKEIEKLGYTIEDTQAGPFLWPRREL